MPVVLLYPWSGRSVLTAGQCGVSHSYPQRWNGNLLAPRCAGHNHKRKNDPAVLFQPGRFCADGVSLIRSTTRTAEARADGRYDIPEGDPAYRPELDKDHNGIACESRKLG